MHALTTTRQLLQEVRDLHEREDVPQQPKQSNQSKRRRMEDIKSQAMENVLTGIVEANIEMHGLFMHELRMAVFDTVTPLEERGTHTHSAKLKQLNS